MAAIGYAKCCPVVRSIKSRVNADHLRFTGELAACHFEDLESSDFSLTASSGAILAR
jgi:hypothetical protein